MGSTELVKAHVNLKLQFVPLFLFVVKAMKEDTCGRDQKPGEYTCKEGEGEWRGRDLHERKCISGDRQPARNS